MLLWNLQLNNARVLVLLSLRKDGKNLLPVIEPQLKLKLEHYRGVIVLHSIRLITASQLTAALHAYLTRFAQGFSDHSHGNFLGQQDL